LSFCFIDVGTAAEAAVVVAVTFELSFFNDDDLISPSEPSVGQSDGSAILHCRQTNKIL
jgi:hypothetical protein